MGKINLLDSSVFNMLAAGEVVVGPSSVVKELVENAIDAGATRIDISIEGGGARRISVSDNGIGIEKGDLRAAFLPHATSKLNKITDLDSLSTLGFRGEALASIASVSEVEMISSYNGDCNKITLVGGEVTSQGPASRASGSVITIENLFFNTPARLKFLKKPALEERYVVDIVGAMILANPELEISLSNEKGTLLMSSGGSLIDAICSVYGVECAEKLLEVKSYEKGGITVSGYTSSTDLTKPNRTYQTIIINGRTVSDPTVRTAVEKAYGDRLMKRAYPIFVINILMPFDEIDVNVHPSKTEVRFTDRQKVFSAVYRAVQQTIDSATDTQKVGFDISSDSGERYVQPRIDTSLLYGRRPSGKELGIGIMPISDSGGQAYRGEDSHVSAHTEKSEKENPATEPFLYPFGGMFGGGSLKEGIDLYAPVDSEGVESVFDGKIIGQIFSTYLLVELDEKLYLIDQHAAHERLLYDKIVASFDANYAQSLLIPYKLRMNGEESEYFEHIMGDLVSFGFRFNETDDGKYLVTSVPEAVSRMDIGKFFNDLFSNMYADSELSLTALLKDTLAHQACRAAIKGGEALSPAQIQRVITNYLDADGKLPDKCPHGRPAVIVITKRDIEKLFKRIV